MRNVIVIPVLGLAEVGKSSFSKQLELSMIQTGSFHTEDITVISIDQPRNCIFSPAIFSCLKEALKDMRRVIILDGLPANYGQVRELVTFFQEDKNHNYIVSGIELDRNVEFETKEEQGYNRRMNQAIGFAKKRWRIATINTEEDSEEVAVMRAIGELFS